MISILFGAGASFGSELHKPSPPLGNYLFHELENQQGAFAGLPEEAKSEFRMHGFEKGMLSVPNDSRVINPLQKEIAVYLSSFSPSYENAYARLFRSLREYTKHINLITLNYDLLIEQSLFMVGAHKILYNVDNGFLQEKLLKVHGSSNFVPILNPNIKFGRIISIDSEAFIETHGVDLLKNHQEVKEWCNSLSNIDFSPVMCMYNKDKRGVINSSYLTEKREEYKRVIAKTKLLFIVGVKYIEHDNHIWDEVLNSAPELIIVDPFPSEDFIDKVKERGIKYTIIKDSFYYCALKISRTIRRNIKIYPQI